MPTENYKTTYKGTTLHPETNTGQVYDFGSGKWLPQVLTDINTAVTTLTNQLVLMDKKTTMDINLYVNATSGLDSNSGSESSPLKTIAATIRKIPKIVDHVVTINLAAATYWEIAILEKFKGTGTIKFVGNVNGNGAYLFQKLIALNCQCRVTIEGVTLLESASEAIAIISSHYARITACAINNEANQAGVKIIHSESHIDWCSINNRSQAIISEKSKVFSQNNSGTGNVVGLLASQSGHIVKDGTQPSATVAQTSTTGGYFIP